MDITKVKALVFDFLGISAEKNEPLKLTAEQTTQVNEHFQKEGFAEAFEARHNEVVASELENDSANEHINAFMAEQTPATEEETPEVGATQEETPKTLTQNVQALTASLQIEKQARLDAEGKIAKMKGLPEQDKPETIEGNLKPTMKHSATHLFASNNSWDSFEGRSWNQLAAGIQGATATDWNTANIEKLNSDIQDYFRKDPKKLVSTFMDGLQLPPHWKLISGVSDEYIFTTISSGEITQGMKIKFLPKNNVSFAAQKGKVRDIQIDIRFQGDELKKLEKSYLNNFFNEGSTPFKDGFIMYVVKELMQQARKEDKIVFGKGVYYPNTNAEVAGSFLNNFSGIIKLALEQRGVTYKPFNLGAPTVEGIYDYVNNFVKLLPHEIRIQPDFIFYLSPTWLNAYQNARRRIQGRDVDFKESKKVTVDGYSNIELYAYDQLEGYDFMFLTTADNIKGLTDKPNESGVLNFARKTEERSTVAVGDYKLAAFIAMFGREQIGEVSTYENQLFFSNDVEVLTDVYVPVEADNGKPSLKWHNSLAIGKNNTTATNITDFADFSEEKVRSKIYLLGNTSKNYSTVKASAKIKLLDGDCVLTKGKILVLIVKADGTYQELYREDESSANLEDEIIVLSNNAETIDASEGVRFGTSENTEETAIGAIENAITGETYRIEGAGTTNASTIEKVGVFDKIPSKMTLSEGTYIELFFNGKKFIEIARG